MKLAIVTLCGKNKYKENNIKALNLYKGNNFPIIRKNYHNNIDTYIVSAKYGLINGTKIINYYEQELDEKRFHEIKEDVKLKFKEILDKNYKEIVILAGGLYKQLFEEFKDNRIKFVYNPFQKARLVLKLFIQKYDIKLNWNNIIENYKNDNIIMRFFK